MNKLYVINVTHFAPKDSHIAVEEYVVAESDRQVFKYLDEGRGNWKESMDEQIENDPDGEEYYKEEYENIFNLKGDYARGYNEVSIEKSQLQGSGVLYYELDTPTNTAIRKMILLK